MTPASAHRRGARRRLLSLCLVATGLLTACTGGQSSTAPSGQPNATRAPAATGPSRITVAIGAEVNSLSSKLEGGNTYASEYNFMVGSPLAVKDPKGVSHPLLAAELPSRDNGSWIVNNDGTMRTTWKIKPNAKWHDGTPVTSKDFVFAFQVYTDPAVGVRSLDPERFMDRVEPIDDKTFDIYWKQSYPWANELLLRELEPLPDHLMRKTYESSDGEAFLANPFWSSPAFVGTGPYRLVQWDPGTQLIFRAFDDYFMGRPKTDEIIFKVVADSNTVVANLLSGAADVTLGITLPQQSAATVKRQWADQGQVAQVPTRWRYMQIQFDPARLQQPALLDVRVRRAIVHALDREAIADIVTDGSSKVAEVPMVPTDALYPQVQQAIPHYPYDVTRALQLLQDAGWTKQGDRLVNSTGQPFTVEMRTTQQTDNETEQSLAAADLTKLGMQPAQVIVPQSRIRDSEYRVTFPGLNATAQSIDIPGILNVATSDACASAERRFVGSNRGCYKNPDFDRLYTTASSSLSESERSNAIVNALRIISDDVGVYGYSYNAESIAIRKGLVGPGSRWPSQIGGTWNVYEWHWER